MCAGAGPRTRLADPQSCTGSCSHLSVVRSPNDGTAPGGFLVLLYPRVWGRVAYCALLYVRVRVLSQWPWVAQ